ncbi:hypothetical protein MKW98_007006 [Papaver atlanticum]|uniref:Uncharacterized protein n=1 Tax=Papaver atlanticum TaxID=357466 RepID=A0AAD4XKX5_9MAGN|nr:hypothetical protein MKW98_007006 [Papaver atlanticum]
MSRFRDDAQYFETRFRNLVDAQENTQRQLDVLATSFTTLIQTLNQHAKYTNHVSFCDQVGRHEVINQQNLAVLPQQPTTPCPDDNDKAVQIAAATQEVMTCPASTSRNNNSNNCNLKESALVRPENDSALHEIDRNIILNTDQNVEEILPPKTPSPQIDSGEYFFQYYFYWLSFVVVEYMSLYQAAQQGDWEKAQELFNGNPSSMTAIITIESVTALLVAADHKQWEFVEKLVRCMPQEALGLKETKFGYTALHIVAREGKTKIAEAMVKKNNNLTQIRDNEGRVPVLIASLFVSLGKRETIEYLLSVTKDESPSPLSGLDGAALICNLLDADYYDIALSLFHRSPKLVMEKANNSSMWPLEVMAQRPFNFQSGSKLNFWQRSIYSS